MSKGNLGEFSSKGDFKEKVDSEIDDFEDLMKMYGGVFNMDGDVSTMDVDECKKNNIGSERGEVGDGDLSNVTISSQCESSTEEDAGYETQESKMAEMKCESSEEVTESTRSARGECC